MSIVYEWFAGLFTVEGFLYFLLGFAAAYVYYYISCALKGKAPKVEWRSAGVVVGVIVIIITSIQSQQAFNTAKKTAEDARRCQIEFNHALQSRTHITSENDEISQEQRRIIYDWIHDLIFPPKPWSELDPNDPQRVAYGIMRTQRTDEVFKRSIERQDELQRQRDANPLPSPTCGS